MSQSRGPTNAVLAERLAQVETRLAGEMAGLNDRLLLEMQSLVAPILLRLDLYEKSQRQTRAWILSALGSFVVGMAVFFWQGVLRA